MPFLATWGKRKAITIAHSDDGAQTNYQVRLDIGESSGSNFSSLKYAGLGASLASGIYDDEAWASPTNIYTDNAAYASVTAATFDTNDFTEVLKATTFGFAIPTLATVKGIKVEVEKYRASANVVDECVQLTKDGTARVGNNKGDTVTNWGTVATVVTYGGSADLWGDTWTPAEINAATFGLHFVAKALGEDADVYLDYVRITVYYDYVNCEGEVASDFSDLRFTTSDGTTLCDYWIESLTGTTPNQLAVVWVEVPSVAAHPDDTTIYMYYSGTQEAASNGSNTFRFFDDFLGASLSTDKWEGSTGSVAIASSQMTIQGVSVNTKVDFVSPCAARMKSAIYQPSGFAGPSNVGFVQPAGGATNGFYIYEDRFANNQTRIVKASTLKQINSNWTKASSLIQELKWNKSAPQVDFFENDVAKTGSPDTTAASIQTVDAPFCFYTVVGSGGYGQVIVDWLLIRNLTLNEPYAAAYGVAVGVPVIETDTPTPNKSSVLGYGHITDDGGDLPTIRGFCYKAGSTGEPTLETDLEAHEHGTFSEGEYSLTVPGLTPNTDYRIRAYCTNAVGTGYGATVTIHTLIAATYVEILTADRALAIDNTTKFNPSADFHPATKKYVDSVDGGLVTDSLIGEELIDLGAPTTDAWDDLMITLANIKAPASLSPTWTAYKGSEVPAFAKNAINTLYFSAQLPHAYKVETDIEFHVHLAYPDATAGNSIWYFTYSWADMGSNLPAESNSGNVTIAAPGVADRHQYGELIATISGAGKGISSVLLCSLSRLGNDGSDDYDNVIYAISADFHYQRDTNGSRLQTAK